ncbi:MAG: hypothetical protein P3X22_002225 [Thermoprotei archaeon]|nr:hypothetical protein [Thermoprotei archaeon]
MALKALERIELYSITYEKAPHDVIGSLGSKVDEIYERLYPKVNGLIVLSTCARFEIYIDSVGYSVEGDISEVLGEAVRYAVKLEGYEVVRHLFKVASGLKSQFIGEHEILGQVRKAWAYARRNNYTSSLLNIIFKRALIAGRRVREETKLGYGAVGYPQAAVELLSRILGGLDGRKILIVGAGQAAEAAVKHLCIKYRPSRVVIANRTLDKAVKVARLCDKGETAGFDERIKLLSEVEGVIVAVSGGVKVFGEGHINLYRVPIVDLSLSAATDYVEGLVYTFDHVKKLSDEYLSVRLSEIPKAEAIVEEEVGRVESDIVLSEVRNLTSNIMKLSAKLYEIEIERTMKSLNGGDADLRRALRLAFHSYMKKVLRPLILYFNDAALKGRYDVVSEVHSYYVRELRRWVE